MEVVLFYFRGALDEPVVVFRSVGCDDCAGVCESVVEGLIIEVVFVVNWFGAVKSTAFNWN